MQKYVPYEFGDKCKDAFDTFKNGFTTIHII